jgi:hypothetical protein
MNQTSTEPATEETQAPGDILPDPPEDVPAQPTHLPNQTRPSCQGISKKTGQRCTAPPIRGESLCAGHAGRGGIDPAEGGRAKARVMRSKAEKRKMTLQDHLAAGLERNAERIVDALLEAGLKGGDWRALEALINRVHGKPTERHEDVTIRSDTERQLDVMTREQRTAWLLELERRRELRSA